MQCVISRDVTQNTALRAAVFNELPTRKHTHKTTHTHTQHTTHHTAHTHTRTLPMPSASCERREINTVQFHMGREGGRALHLRDTEGNEELCVCVCVCVCDCVSVSLFL